MKTKINRRRNRTSVPEYSEEYYEHLARTMGEESAAWARLPPDERTKELKWHHANFDTPDDLAEWPPELDGGLRNGFEPSVGSLFRTTPKSGRLAKRHAPTPR